MASVFIKVPVSQKHIGNWCFYLTPTGFKGFGLIEKPAVCQGLYRCNDTYACFVLEEIELPTEEAARQFANEMAGDGHYNISEIDAFVDGFNYLYEDLKGGSK